MFKQAVVALLAASTVFSQSTISNNPGTKLSVVIRGATIHTISNGDIQNGVIVLSNGVITALGNDTTPTPSNAKVIDGKGLHVYPGMIDSGTNIGLTEIGSVRGTNDISELGDYNPNARTEVALNPHSNVIPVTRANGVLLALSQPEGGIVAGSSAVIRMAGWTPAEMVVKSPAGMHIRYPQGRPSSVSLVQDEDNEKERRKGYERRLDSLRDLMRDAQAYRTSVEAKQQRAQTPRAEKDLVLEALAPLLRGEVPAIIHAERESDIRDALKFADDHKLRVILSGGHDVQKVIAELKQRKTPVLLGPILALPQNEDDAYDLLFTNAKALHDAGIPFAIQSSDSHNSRNLPYHAAACAAFGLPKEAALRAVTLSAAEILGIADRYGSLDVGKSATLFLSDGDPLEIRTQVRAIFIEGEEIPLDSRHTDLYEKFLNRPK